MLPITITHAGGAILANATSLNIDSNGRIALVVNENLASSGGGTPVDDPIVTPPTPTPVNAFKMTKGEKHAGSTSANSPQKYYFILDENVGRVVIQVTTDDWVGNVNIIASTQRQPDCSNFTGDGSGADGYYFNINDTSNEIIYILTPFPAGTVFYVTVCGEGNYRVFYNAY